MRKTILFQTDFSLESLKGVKKILADSTHDSRFDIILLHGFRLSDSINELLFFSKHQTIKKLSNSTFTDAHKVLLNKYSSKISSFRIDLFTGWNMAAFSNFLEANQVDCIYQTNHHVFQAKCPESFDLQPFFQKTAVVKEIPAEADPEILQPEKGKLAELFIL